MAKGRQVGKAKRKSSRPRINLLHVVYLIVALSMVISLVAGVFGGSPSQPTQSVPTTSQSAPRDTGPRLPVVLTPGPAAENPTPNAQ